METKQVIVLRKDLNMRKGKMCAQAAHASMKVLLDNAIKLSNGRIFIINADPPNDPLYTWLNGLFTKVVVGCDSEDEILQLEYNANRAKIPNAVIVDSGKTEFEGNPTVTCIAIGPDEVERIDKITGHLKLL